MSNDNSAPKDWKTMEAFKDDASFNLQAPTDDLNGKELSFTFTESAAANQPMQVIMPVHIRFVVNGAASLYVCDGQEYKASVTAFDNGEGYYYLSCEILEPSNEDANIIFNINTGRAIGVLAIARDQQVTGECRVKQTFYIGGLAGAAEGARPPERTRDLIGTRLVVNYSPDMYYEHNYLNSERICWHNLKGDQFGHAASETCDYFKIDEDLYLISWRELFIPCGATYLLNFKSNVAMGKFIGWDNDNKISHSFSGGYMTVLSKTIYPKECQPK